MLIAIEPNEANPQSNLPKALLSGRYSVLMPKLEHYTGADLLLSPLEAPKLTELAEVDGDLDALSRIKLAKHCQAGRLVQRKSGKDILTFIPNARVIFEKMKQWTDRPWLLVTGLANCSEPGKLILDGELLEGWAYFSLQGALDTWQDLGGCLSIVAKDSLITAWCSYTMQRLLDPETEKLISPRKATTKSIVAGEGEELPERQRSFCIAMLSAIPGVGVTKAVAVADYCGGKFKDAWSFIADPTNLKLKNVHESFPKQIGPTIFATVRELSGLDSGGESEAETWLEVPTTTTVFPYRKEVDNPPWEKERA